MSTDPPLRRILVAGVGNAWLRDDGFGGEVARRLEQLDLPDDVAVMDAGTGGLDLAYEVMRGYDALVILDVSRQGGEPGTLYVMEADEESVAGQIEDEVESRRGVVDGLGLLPVRVRFGAEKILGRPARTYAEWVADNAFAFGTDEEKGDN